LRWPSCFCIKTTNQTSQLMKKSICLAASLLALNLTPVFGQPFAPTAGQPQPTTFAERLAKINARAATDQANAPALTKFNLDFPGGTPKELVAAIEKAMGKPLNVIIASDEKSAKAKLPPVKVSDMDVARLFNSLEQREVSQDHNDVVYSQRFYTQDQSPKDNSLWTFSVYAKQSALTKFDLDFAGGTPAQLVKAIEKATGKPLNVIINKEDENVELPPLKMNDVDVQRLFTALEVASAKQVKVITGTYGMGMGGMNSSYSSTTTSYGFKTEGTVNDNSVWYFHMSKPAEAPIPPVEKVTQYYSLSPYLDRGFTVDDITTAIQTGWKMAGVTPTPELSYHKETKMLIAYGEPAKLNTIQSVLQTLPQVKEEFWRQANDRIRELQKQVDLLNKQLNQPPGDSNPIYRQLFEKRQSEMNVSTNTPAEKSGK
jgi:hypothetical protein